MTWKALFGGKDLTGAIDPELRTEQACRYRIDALQRRGGESSRFFMKVYCKRGSWIPWNAWLLQGCLSGFPALLNQRNKPQGAPHKIIQPVTNPAQKTRMGFYFAYENPAGEKFIACKDIAEGLLVLSSCWPTQTLHVFTTPFPLIFQSLANRAWMQLSSSLQRLCQQRNPLPDLCMVSFLAGGCPVLQCPFSATQQYQVFMFSGADKSKLVSNFPPVLPFYKICGRNCS